MTHKMTQAIYYEALTNLFFVPPGGTSYWGSGPLVALVGSLALGWDIKIAQTVEREIWRDAVKTAIKSGLPKFLT